MLDTVLEPLLENPITSIFSFVITLIPIYVAYVLFQHPLSHIPRPLIRRVTSLPLLYSSWIGTEASSIANLHAQYGPAVLIAPNDIDIDDGAAISPIYVEKGGFTKAKHYRNFDFDAHQTIFSTQDLTRRIVRAKSVAPLFSTVKIREAATSGNVIDQCVNDFIAALDRAKAVRAEAVDIFDLSRRLAVDVVTGFLFDQRWSSFDSEIKASVNGKLSSSPFVDNLLTIGPIFLLPPWLFTVLANLLPALQPSKVELESSNRVEAFAQEVCDSSIESEADTFQKRLLDAGISQEETKAQMKDLIFAGTDSTGTMMSKLIWNLTQQSDLLHALYKELSTNPTRPTPLLHATVREGLRTGMANPTPLARIVPPQGWTYTASQRSDEDDGKTYTGKAFPLPAGTRVGVQMYSLHFNEETFSEPREFNPYRWMTTEEASGPNGMSNNDTATMARMNRDWFAFGAGTRQCIARNLATEELTLTLRRIVESRVLEGAKVLHRELPIREWFNSQLVDRNGIMISFEGV